MSRRVQLLCAWCGPVLIVLLAGGLIGLAGFWPPPRPNDSAQQIVSLYSDHATRVRIGLCVMMASLGLIVPWGCVIAVQTTRAMKGTPVLAYVQVAAMGVTTIIGVASVIAWGVSSFRPGDIPAETTRAFNDLGWLFFVFDWSPVFIWYVAVGLAIFSDEGEPSVFPRWAGYLSLWTALLSVPGGVVILFKTGPLAFNGVLGIWIPLGVFLIWIIVMTVLVIRAIDSESPMPEPA